MQWYARDQGEFWPFYPPTVFLPDVILRVKLHVILKSHRDESFALDADFLWLFFAKFSEFIISPFLD